MTLKDIGELAAIRRVAARLPPGAGVVVGPGDDCAVVRCGGEEDLLLTSDPVVEGIHFAPGTPARLVGHKAVGRALSDIAAMGGSARWALVDIVAPARTAVETLDGLYDGALDLAGRHGLAIVGGDMSEGPALELHVFAVGAVARGRAVLRSGARPGDALFVTGALGGSLSGKHLSFEPRMREGAWLAGRATAMIDVSDGLASDLRHLAEASGAGCELETDRIPLSDAARGAGSEAALDRALHDGEDFELLFTAPAAEAARLLADWRAAFPLACSRIGTMTAHAGRIMCRGGDAGPVPLRATAYEHFRHSSGAAGKTARPA